MVEVVVTYSIHSQLPEIKQCLRIFASVFYLYPQVIFVTLVLLSKIASVLEVTGLSTDPDSSIQIERQFI